MKRPDNTDILRIRNLSVRFHTGGADLRAVRDLDLTIGEGTTLGLVGESGCGKSVTAFSVMRLLSPPGRIVAGELLYRGKDLLKLDDEAMRKVRGREIAMIFQEPMTSLNPVFKIGFQIAEPLVEHLGLGKKQALENAVELLSLVGIPDPGKRINAYPHELSGGMRQRVMIAMALSASPALLIADEPTTALDVTIQAQILELLLSLQKNRGMSLLLITHDLGIVANVADEVAIMYAGEIVETGTVKKVFEKPLHPYTMGLFEAIPRIGDRGKKLNPIPGTVPSITSAPDGCVFYPRCTRRIDECLAAPVVLTAKNDGRRVRCIRA